MSRMIVSSIVAFFIGVFTLALVQAVGLVYYFIRRKKPIDSDKVASLLLLNNGSSSEDVVIEGSVWIPCSLVKTDECTQQQRNSKDQRNKLEGIYKPAVAVTHRNAKIKGSTLVLVDSEGVCCSFSLKGCDVEAVTNTKVPTQKWSRKYPIWLHQNSHPLLPGSKDCMLYFATNWEKESWFYALHMASTTNDMKHAWYLNLRKEFYEYFDCLKVQYPDYFKSGPFPGKLCQKAAFQTKKPSSWKRILKKRTNRLSYHPEGQTCSKATVHGEDQQHASKEDKQSSLSSLKSHDNVDSEDTAKFSDNSNDILNQQISQGVKELENVEIQTHTEEGVLSTNLLFARMFFDMYHSSAIIASIHRRIQRLLSRISTPSYIAPIICSHIDLGKVPPLIHAIRLLAMDVDGTCGVELDVSYTGGAVLTLETRLDARESQDKLNDLKVECNPAGAATMDIVEKSLESAEDQWKLTSVEVEYNAGQHSDEDHTSSPKGSKRWVQSSKSGWKGLVSHLADQVSQVPLNLSMRVGYMKGTMQIRFKPPPSDRVWFGFCSMPDLDLIPEPSIGDHKISTAPLIAFIADRIKALISETLVLPQFGDLYVPWMITNSDDMLVPQESIASIKKDIVKGERLPSKEGPSVCKSSNSIKETKAQTSSDLERPLLEKAEQLQSRNLDEERMALIIPAEAQHLSSSDSELSSSSQNMNEDSASFRKRSVKREKMINLGKKMGAKFEEKTRQLAERMRRRAEA